MTVSNSWSQGYTEVDALDHDHAISSFLETTLGSFPSTRVPLQNPLPSVVQVADNPRRGDPSVGIPIS